MPETIGQQLRQAREARNLTYIKVTQATHIQARFIKAMEADDFESLPSPVQVRAFLRIYTEYLGLSLDDLISRQQPAISASLKTSNLSESAPVPNKKSGKVADNPTATTPAGGLKANKSSGSKKGIKYPNPDIDQSRSQFPTPQTVFNSSNQRVSGEPEQTARSQVAPVVPEEEESTQSKVELPIQTGKIPSERKESEIIFASIGKALQQHREILSFTLDEVENHTRVRKHYLQALEEGNFDHLPSSVQARGMLNNYAHFLDMDVDAILLKFAEGLQAQRLERQPAPVEKKRTVNEKTSSKKNPFSGLRRYFSMDVLVGSGLILVLVVFAIWGTARVITLRSATTPQATAQSISDVLKALPGADTPTPVPTGEAVTKTDLPVPSSTFLVTVPVSGKGPVQVVLVAIEQAFVRVIVDGKILFDGRVTAGKAYPFDGNSQIEILTGNGAAISILFNQSDLGPMGRIGEVVDRIYTANAILNPTATITPTPSITPTPTKTPLQSPTPRPGSTSPTPGLTQTY